MNTCVRETERNLDLEGPFGARQVLLALSPNGRHWEYVREAHRRRFGCLRPDGNFDPSCRQDGSYHTFEPGERPIQAGDIIVRDRRANRTDDTPTTPSNVWRFRDSQTNQGEMHGDIVVEVDRSATPPCAEAVGGNVGDGARRRRFPLNADGTLIVDRAHNFRQQRNDGTFLPLPSAGSAAGNTDDLSTRRIFRRPAPGRGVHAAPGTAGGAGDQLRLSHLRRSRLPPPRDCGRAPLPELSSSGPGFGLRLLPTAASQSNLLPPFRGCRRLSASTCL